MNLCIVSFVENTDKILSGSDWASLLPFGIACAAVGYGVKVLLDQNVSEIFLLIIYRRALISLSGANRHKTTDTD